METVDTQVDSRAFSYLYHLVLQLFLHLLHHLLDTCGVDTSVSYQLMESQAADLTSYGIESTDNNSFRGIVNNNLYTCGSLQCTDISTLTTDDTSLHLVVLDMEDTHAVLNGCLSSHTLNGLNHNLACLGIGIQFGLVHNLVDITLSVGLGLIFHRLYQAVLSFLSTQS